MDKVTESIPKFSSRYLDFSYKRGISWYAYTHRHFQNGVMGDPTKATAEKGVKMWEVMISHLVNLVEDLKHDAGRNLPAAILTQLFTVSFRLKCNGMPESLILDPCLRRMTIQTMKPMNLMNPIHRITTQQIPIAPEVAGNLALF